MIGVLEYVARLPRPAEVSTVRAAPRAPLQGALPWRVVGLAATHLLQTLLLLASWACIGYGALSGRLDMGWLTAWAMALGTTVPVQAYATWLEGLLVIRIGTLLKERLLSGALAMDPERVRRKGSAALLSEVLESGAIDELGASGSIATALALLDLLVAIWISLHAAAALPECLVLMSWLVLAAGCIAYNAVCQYRWTQQRVRLTADLVEKMSAHRTRLAQLQPSDWHSGEDVALDAYLRTSESMDRNSAGIAALLSSGYVIVGFAALAPSFVTGGASLGALAITLGAILFAADAFSRLSLGFTRMSAAWIAWRMLRPVFATPVAAAPETAGIARRSDSVAVEVALVARDLRFAHPAHPVPMLQGCDLRIGRGDQILLEGPSGGGKSTLAGILAGQRTASGGYILYDGLDRQTLGDLEWRRRVALVPQYHENHIIAGTLLFNLLLSRALPHTPADAAEAAEVCAELGLQPLLERMPAGLNQFIGDTGWRLSQGERSRIYLARALLQHAGVVILDESLAALDPENLQQCLETVMRRAPTLVVIAHP